MRVFKIKSFQYPAVVIFSSSLLSFFGWLIMTENMYYTLRKPFSVFSFGVLLTFVWIFLAVAYVFFGFEIGRRININSKFIDKYVAIDSDLVYKVVLVIAFTGVSYSTYIILDKVNGFAGVWELISNSQANYLKKALYSDYSIGLRSLRYVSIHAATLAIIRRIVFKKKNVKLDVIAFICLIFTALISSRLSIIVTILQSTIIIGIFKDPKIKFRKLLMFGLLFYLLISTFNYTRNYGFYKKYGGMNFFEAGASDILVYLGAPFQGAVSVGENHHLIKHDPMNWYNYSGIPSSLTTNSSFLYFYRDYGWWCFLVAFLFLFSYSFIAGIFRNFQNSILLLVYTSIMYIFAEFWRVYLFYQGIMIALILVPFLVCVMIIFLKGLGLKLK